MKHRWSMLVVTVAIVAGRSVRADPEEFFETKIRPVLAEQCYRCHSTASDKSKASLRLDTKKDVEKGGESGKLIVPGKPDESLLIKAIRYGDESLQMPPNKKLPAEVIRDFEQWVATGAAYPPPRETNAMDSEKPHWSFVSPVKTPLPAVKHAGWVKDPIDRFVLAKLEAVGLTPNAAADRRTLIRRATYDLIGLPPKADEVDAFIADASPDAFAKVVDRLLASPHYGERWGRYWLDVARYADSKGYVFQEERRYPYAYTYRDWVIRAINDDLAYNEFLVQQIAADRLGSKSDTRPLAAMGFLTVGRRFLNNQHDIIDDRLDVVCRGTMALTVSCAKCHDHKFDPVPMKDYYSLYGVFASSTEPAELPLIVPCEKSPQTEAFEHDMAAKQAEIAAFVKKRYGEIMTLVRTPEQSAAHLAAAKEVVLKKANQHTLAHDRNLRQPIIERMVALLRKAGKPEEVAASVAAENIIKQAEAGPESPFNIPLEQAESLFLRDDNEKMAGLRSAAEALKVTHPGAPPRAMAMVDLPKPAEPVVFLRGNPANRGPKVPRRFLSVLGGSDAAPFKNGSGRLELAQAIASADNPLTARVMVNRVWIGHFGKGIVRTPSDFGTRGEPPTHPELLDYLAVTFMDEGWSLKKLHRRIMLSATYQQASTLNPSAFAADPENRLIWRMNLRRLDFEATRDSLLVAAGRLDEAMFGRPFDMGDAGARRRTIYGFIDRQNLPGMFRAFDFASPDTHSPQRFTTTVPQQALFMMNSPFVIEQAKALAALADVAAAKDVTAKIAVMYRIVMQRVPTEEETALGRAFAEKEPAASKGLSPLEKYAQVLLMANELAFVD